MSRTKTIDCWFEGLEKRELLSALLDGGVLSISGTDGNDRMVIVAGNELGQVRVRGSVNEANGRYDGVDAVVVELGEGNDRIKVQGKLRDTSGEMIGVTINGGAGNDRIKGGLGGDTIDGGEGNDVIKGGEGDDTIIGGAGNDRMNGQKGFDTVSFGTSPGGVDVSLDRRRAVSDGFGGKDAKVKGFEGVIGSLFDDHIEGDQKDNMLDGGGGDDVVLGMGGSDDVIDRSSPTDNPPAVVLLIDDQAGGYGDTAEVLRADGHTVTEVTNEFDNGRANLLDGEYLSGFDMVIWAARGNGFGTETSEEVVVSLEAYIQNGRGDLLVTGYDSLGDPEDFLLAGLVRSLTYDDQASGSGAWELQDVDNFILNGLYGDFRGLKFSAEGYDDDLLVADTERGAITLATTPGHSDRVIFTEIAFGGSVGYWNGGGVVVDGNAQMDFSTPGETQELLRNWVAGSTRYQALGDGDGPQIEMGLLNDTGRSDSDRITNDLTVTGRVEDPAGVAAVRVALEGDTLGEWIDVTDSINEAGEFTIDLAVPWKFPSGPIIEYYNDVEEVEPNDDGELGVSLADFELAQDLTDQFIRIEQHQAGVLVEGAIDFGDDRDWDIYKFHANTVETVSAEIYGRSLLEPSLQLFDRYGNQLQIARVDEYFSDYVYLDTDDLPYDGDYYLVADSEGSTAGNFDLLVTRVIENLDDGDYVVRLQASSNDGHEIELPGLPVTLDTQASELSLELLPLHDTEPLDDRQTVRAIVTLQGEAEPNVDIQLTAKTGVLDDFDNYEYFEVIGDDSGSQRWQLFGAAASSELRVRSNYNNDTQSGLVTLDWPGAEGVDKSFASIRLGFAGPTNLSDQALVKAWLRSSGSDVDSEVKLLISNETTTYHSRDGIPLNYLMETLNFKMSAANMVLVEGDDSYEQVVAGTTGIGFTFQNPDDSELEYIRIDDFILPLAAGTNPDTIDTETDSSGNFTLENVPLAIGPNALMVRAEDIAGNVSEAELSLFRYGDGMALDGGLANDTGANMVDGITLDTTIAGFVSDSNEIINFRGGFDDVGEESFVDLLGDLSGAGDFIFTPERLNEINGAALTTEAEHTLHLIAENALGVIKTLDISFMIGLAGTAPVIELELLNDDGHSASDGVATKPDLVGQISSVSDIASLVGGFDDTPVEEYVDLKPDIQPDGSLYFSKDRLDQIKGSVIQTPLAINFNDLYLYPYAGQDDDSSILVEDDGATIRLTDNGWKKLDLGGLKITSNTILEFDYQSSVQGELQGIGFAKNDTLTADQAILIKLYGSDEFSFGSYDYDDYKDTAPGVQHYTIPVGEIATGDYRFLTFINDHDSGMSNAQSVFSNIEIYEADSRSADHVLHIQATDDQGLTSSVDVPFTINSIFISQGVKLKADDADFLDIFGKSVAYDGNLALIGAHGNNQGDKNTGSAYLFDVVTGEQLMELTASDGDHNDYFGESVSIHGDRALIGATFDVVDGARTGSAYIFDVTTGEELFKLTAPDATDHMHFGSTVSISGNNALVGAPNEDREGDQTGAVYVFDVSTGEFLYKLTPDDVNPYRRFGLSLMVSGNYAVIGGIKSSDLTGSAYVFDVITGEQLFKLSIPEAVSASSVSISDNLAIIGVSLGASRPGRAYIYDVTTGEQLIELIPNDIDGDSFYGLSVSIEGRFAVVGAPGDDDGGFNTGAIYLFDVATGNQLAKIKNMHLNYTDRIGSSLAIHGNKVIAGVPNDDHSGSNSGSAYVFNILGL